MRFALHNLSLLLIQTRFKMSFIFKGRTMFLSRNLTRFFSVLMLTAVLGFLEACNSASTAPGGGVGGGNDTTSVDPGVNALGENNGIVFATSSHTWKIGNANVYRYGPAGKRQLDVDNYVYVNKAKTGLVDTTRYQGIVVYSMSVIVKMVAPGTHTCATGDSIEVFGSSSIGGTTYTSTACEIQVDYMSAFGGMSGKIVSATLVGPGGKTITFKNAPFRVYQHYGTVGTAPALTSDSSATLQIDSGSFELPQGRYFTLKSPASAVGASFSIIPNDGTYYLDGISLVMSSVPNQVGTWHCGEFFSGGYTGLQVWLGTYQSEHAFFSGRANGATVSTCTINVTSQPTNNRSRGNYTATLIVNATNDTTLLTLAKRTIKVHGEFRQ